MEGKGRWIRRIEGVRKKGGHKEGERKWAGRRTERRRREGTEVRLTPKIASTVGRLERNFIKKGSNTWGSFSGGNATVTWDRNAIAAVLFFFVDDYIPN